MSVINRITTLRKESGVTGEKEPSSRHLNSRPLISQSRWLSNLFTVSKASEKKTRQHGGAFREVSIENRHRISANLKSHSPTILSCGVFLRALKKNNLAAARIMLIWSLIKFMTSCLCKRDGFISEVYCSRASSSAGNWWPQLASRWKIAK